MIIQQLQRQWYVRSYEYIHRASQRCYHLVAWTNVQCRSLHPLPKILMLSVAASADILHPLHLISSHSFLSFLCRDIIFSLRHYITFSRPFGHRHDPFSLREEISWWIE